MSADWLAGIPARWRETGSGVVSICSAHPWVIEASLTGDDTPVLIEATCNQVNQEGGYTGMTPVAFRHFVEDIARGVGFDPSLIVLGGDHLGPNPWKHLSLDQAMARAEAMVVAYVEAGFSKLHLDTSMGCRGEPEALGDDIVAGRAAHLAAAAEQAAQRVGCPPPAYVIGTEVPTPGGATHKLDAIEVTTPEAALATLAAHRSAFADKKISDAFRRVIAAVVQPGVEFDHEHVAPYDPPRVGQLRKVLSREGDIVFEAHSTDYQPPELLHRLVADGFAILKVGPALTFAMREALYGLDRIASEQNPDWREQSLEAAMEKIMLADPAHWKLHYRGSPDQLRTLRHHSLSDRIRYYWPSAEARAAVTRLFFEIESAPIPASLIAAFLPHPHAAEQSDKVEVRPKTLILDAVRRVLANYTSATRGEPMVISQGATA
jgi:D-tagatose-bisphosphate aldolase class II non-catalytic subunit